MDYLNSELITPKEKEGFTSCHSPKGEDRKEPQFDILLREQGGVNSLIDKRSQINSILILTTKKKGQKMKKLFFRMPTEFGNECSKIEFMTAADYEICETVEEFIKRGTSVLGEECCSVMEAAHRGLSHKMQLVLTHRLMNYLVYGRRSSTGVQHADELLEKIISSIPKDMRDYLETIWPEYIAKDRLRNRGNVN